MGQDPTPEAETKGVSVAGTAKAAGRPQGGKIEARMGRDARARLDAQHESPVDA